MDNIRDSWSSTEFLAPPNYKGPRIWGLGLGTACHAALETFHCLNYAAYKFLGVSATEGGH